MTRYIFCVIAVLVQPLFVWYVYHKQDKREAALKIPMIGCSVLYLVVQVYAFFKLCIKIPGKYGIFSYLIQAVILAVFIALELALSGSNKYIKKDLPFGRTGLSSIIFLLIGLSLETVYSA